MTPVAVAALAVLAVLWLGGAAWATAVALRRGAAARGAVEEVERLSLLLAGAPAMPVLVHGNGRIDAPVRLRDWLGLAEMPERVEDFSAVEGGILPADAAALAVDVATIARSGESMSRALRLSGSGRILRVEGRRAAGLVADPSAVLLWLFDATGSEVVIADLNEQLDRSREALGAISSLIEAAPFPMWHRSPDLRLTLVNSAYVAAVEGETAADVVARGLELIEPASGRSPIAAAAAAREEGVAISRTAPAIVAGNRRTMRITDVPLGPAGVAGYAVDVEELELAHHALDQFAAAQRDLLDRVSAGVAQFAADRSLVFWNQPFARMFALKPEWLADHPEFERVLERMRESDRLPESRDFPRWKMERRAWFTAASGAIEESWLLPGGDHLRVVAQPLPDGGILLIFEDRTEQVRLASARDTLLRVRTATFDNLFEAIGVFASDGRLHLWNSRFRELWGLEEEVLAEHPRVDAFAEAVAPLLAGRAMAGRIRDLVRAATVDRRQQSGRVAFADGRHMEFAVVPLPDGNALFTLLDITDSRRIEAALRERAQALEEADRVKTAFVAGMSYELRTPLTSIGGFAEMLAAGYAGVLEPQAKDYVAAILEAVARLGALVDDVLALTESEADAAREGPPAETIVVAALAREAGEAMRRGAEARALRFDLQIDPSAGSIAGDAKRLRQAIDHLLRNAIAYTPGGGSVLLHVAGDAEGVSITVSDNGIGIAEADRQRVFDRFHRAAPAAEGDASLGLGLPLTRQFVEQHGGTVTLESEPGQGTTVAIQLPRGGR